MRSQQLTLITSDATTLSIIRAKISSFVTMRDRAYKSIQSKGHPIPDYGTKMKAIAALRSQLSASSGWDLQANLRWIHAMRHLITELLPYEFHDDRKQLTYRKHIVDLLNYCDDMLDTKSIVSPKPSLV